MYWIVFRKQQTKDVKIIYFLALIFLYLTRAHGPMTIHDTHDKYRT